MAARLVFVLLLVTTLTAVAAGCGGGDSSGLSAESQAAVDQIQSICDDAAAKVDASRGEFPVADFDPENPNPADLPAVGRYFAVGHPIWEEALEETRAVTVPTEIQGQVDTLLSAVERNLANAEAQAKAAQASDVAGFTATLEEAGSSGDAVKEAADTLGLDCRLLEA
jgi:hypothetical protein